MPIPFPFHSSPSYNYPFLPPPLSLHSLLPSPQTPPFASPQWGSEAITPGKFFTSLRCPQVSFGAVLATAWHVYYMRFCLRNKFFELCIESFWYFCISIVRRCQ